MRRAIVLVAVAAAAAACSGLPAAENGVVSLEVRVPDSLHLFVGDSVTLHARADNLQGDSVDAPIRWRTADTALISLDSIGGVVVDLVDTNAVALVQASVGTLHSTPIPITLRDTATAAGVRVRP